MGGSSLSIPVSRPACATSSSCHGSTAVWKRRGLRVARSGGGGGISSWGSPRIFVQRAKQASLADVLVADSGGSRVRSTLEKARASDAMPVVKLAFEFLVLTAARWGEVRGTVWSEIDRAERVWTVPDAHEGQAPAPRAAVWPRHGSPCGGPELGGGSPIVFARGHGRELAEKQHRQMLSKLGIAAVPHGFQSSFRDWAAEETDHRLSDRHRLLRRSWCNHPRSTDQRSVRSPGLGSRSPADSKLDSSRRGRETGTKKGCPTAAAQSGADLISTAFPTGHLHMSTLPDAESRPSQRARDPKGLSQLLSPSAPGCQLITVIGTRGDALGPVSRQWPPDANHFPA